MGEAEGEGPTESHLLLGGRIAEQDVWTEVLELTNLTVETIGAQPFDDSIIEPWGQLSGPDRERITSQVPNVDHPLLPQAVTRRDEHPKRLLADTHAVQLWTDDRAAGEPDIETARVESGDDVGLPHLARLQANLGERVVDGGDDRRQRLSGHRRGVGDEELARGALSSLRRPLTGSSDSCKDVDGMGEQYRPGLSQLDSTSVAIEQAGPERPFQLSEVAPV